MQYIKGDKVIQATERAYNLIFKDKGYKPLQDEEIDISKHHTGGGWYEINGEKIHGKENAIKALKG